MIWRTKTNAALREREFLERLEPVRGILFKVASSYCRLPEDRDELIQEIMGQLWRAFPKYDRSRSFSTWIYRIALNVAISSARSRGRRPSVVLDERVDELPDHSGAGQEPDERIRELHRFIDQLDDLDRALVLLYLEDHAYREIAEVLGITETNVATKLSRLKQRMSNEMNPARTEGQARYGS